MKNIVIIIVDMDSASDLGLQVKVMMIASCDTIALHAPETLFLFFFKKVHLE